MHKLGTWTKEMYLKAREDVKSGEAYMVARFALGELKRVECFGVYYQDMWIDTFDTLGEMEHTYGKQYWRVS